MRPTHTQLLTIIEAYLATYSTAAHIEKNFKNIGGVCQGYSMTVADYILNQERNTLNVVLDTLHRYAENFDELNNALKSAVMRQRFQVLVQNILKTIDHNKPLTNIDIYNLELLGISLEEAIKSPINVSQVRELIVETLEKDRLLVEVRAFIEAILLRHRPNPLSQSWLSAKESSDFPPQQSIKSQLLLINNTLMADKYHHDMAVISVKNIAFYSHLFHRKELTAYMAQVRKVLPNSHPIIILGDGHTVVAWRNHEHWYIDDINDAATAYIYRDQEAANYLINATSPSQSKYHFFSFAFMAKHQDKKLTESLDSIDKRFINDLMQMSRINHKGKSLSDLCHRFNDKSKSLLIKGCNDWRNFVIDNKTIPEDSTAFSSWLCWMDFNKFCLADKKNILKFAETMAEEIAMKARCYLSLCGSSTWVEIVNWAVENNVTVDRILQNSKHLGEQGLLQSLELAYKRGRDDVFHALLETNPSVDISCYQKFIHSSLLIRLVRGLKGLTQDTIDNLAQFLDTTPVSSMKDPDEMDDRNENALFYACKYGNSALVNLLLSRGSTVDIGDRSCLYAALKNSHDDSEAIIVSLIESSKSLNNICSIIAGEPCFDQDFLAYREVIMQTKAFGELQSQARLSLKQVSNYQLGDRFFTQPSQKKSFPAYKHQEPKLEVSNPYSILSTLN